MRDDSFFKAHEKLMSRGMWDDAGLAAFAQHVLGERRTISVEEARSWLDGTEEPPREVRNALIAKAAGKHYP